MIVNRHSAKTLRKVHRYLGLFLGVQFLLWTLSGFYFSWTNLDEIHGDQFKNPNYTPSSFKELINPSSLDLEEGISSLEIRDINGNPHYWINNKLLVDAGSGDVRNEISEEEALAVANGHLMGGLVVSSVEKIKTVGKHHEYREKLLPAYVISFKGDDKLKAYVSTRDGAFQTVRHRAWRWFDFLWMTHTMDYEGRDNFNTTLLRAFSLLGLFTVASGFTLWFISSPTILKIKNRIT